MPFRRAVQIASLTVFLAALTAAIFPALGTWPLDLFIGADPALAAVTALSGRLPLWAFLPALIVVALGLVLGRVFCGYVCPMGTTIDGADKLLKPAQPKPRARKGHNIKYLILAFLLGGAVLGVSWLHFVSPLSLITRLYGLVIYPLLAALADLSMIGLRPLAEEMGWYGLAFAQLRTPFYAGAGAVAAIFLAIFAAARFTPRFWCRYLCPAGALIALASVRPLLRRQVSEDCNACGVCAARCPMGAIPEDAPHTTVYSECLLCRTCETVCSRGGVSFGFAWPGPATAAPAFSSARRQVLAAGVAAGAGLAGAGLALPAASEAAGPHKPGGHPRPPGAVPEFDFLARCTRCGVCVAACPTNALQPDGLQGGLMSLFSPVVRPLSGPCDPHCTRCGDVCPTEALRALAGEERLWAKLGTAVILREDCIAWEDQEKCMVCDEVCPFDAVIFEFEPGNPVPVPHVREERCVGCGYCENACPVKGDPSAIFVTAQDALRLAEGSYAEEGRRRGLDIAFEENRTADPHPYAPPYPGEAPAADAPAPGFTY